MGLRAAAGWVASKAAARAGFEPGAPARSGTCFPQARRPRKQPEARRFWPGCPAPRASGRRAGLVHYSWIFAPHKLDDLPKYLLLHDGHTRPVRAPPPGLAADIPSGGLELELQQEIPVI